MFCGKNAHTYDDQTSTFLSVYGTTCFEIDDSKSRLLAPASQIADPQKNLWLMHEVLDHPDLYKNYPHLKNTPVFWYPRPPKSTGKRCAGEAIPQGEDLFHKTPQHLRSDFIRVYTDGQTTPHSLHKTLLHESQHLIDYHERRIITQNSAGRSPTLFNHPIFNKFVSSPHTERSFQEEVDFMTRSLVRYNEDNPHHADTFKQYFNSFQSTAFHRFSQASTNDYKFKVSIAEPAPHIPVAHQALIMKCLTYRCLQKIAKDMGEIPDVADLRYIFEPTEIVAREVESRSALTPEKRFKLRPTFAETWPPQAQQARPISAPQIQNESPAPIQHQPVEPPKTATSPTQQFNKESKPLLLKGGVTKAALIGIATGYVANALVSLFVNSNHASDKKPASPSP